MGKEKNLAVKQFIKEIIYSKENILIRFDSAEIIDDDTALLGEDSLRVEARSFGAGGDSQALGGAGRINKTSLKEISTENLKKIIGEIRKVIPFGFNKHMVGIQDSK